MTILSQKEVAAICENGHTKGPWHVYDDEGDQTIVSAGDKPVSDVWRVSITPEGEKEEVANAEIQAASPDLAETAKHLYGCVEAMRNTLELLCYHWDNNLNNLDCGPEFDTREDARRLLKEIHRMRESYD